MNSSIKTKKSTDSDQKKSAKALVKAPKTTPAVIDPLRQYLNQISHYKILSREEEAELTKEYAETKDKAIAQKLVMSNLRLVVKIAYEYQRAYHNTLDLIQEGNVGLIRAVGKYDQNKGTRFSYYASWWIRAYILKYIIDNFRLVKIGTTQAQKKLFFNLMKEKRKLESLGFQPNVGLLSEKLDVKEKEIVEMEQRLGKGDMSLDAPYKGEDDKTQLDFFANDDESVADQVEKGELTTLLFKNLKEFSKLLNEKEQRVFSERLYAEVPKTLQEIANNYGITRERVRQIEVRVVEKLKEFFQKKGFEVNLNKSAD